MDISIEKEKKEGHIIYHDSFVFQLVSQHSINIFPPFWLQTHLALGLLCSS